MATPVNLSGVCWPSRSACCLGTGYTIPAAMSHGLDPEMLDHPHKNAVLTFLYAHLPTPPVSAAAALSCAAAAEVPDDVDRISALLDDLLLRVVSRLPAKDGARTAALSTRWRGLWRAAPLALADTHLLPGGEVRPPHPGAASRAVRHAVSAALGAHPGPFPFVSLTCGFLDAVDADRAALARWFQLLATKGVEELVFVNRPWPLPGLRLPAALFSCAALRRLCLGAWRLVDTAALPRGTCFPNLRDLVLGAVAMEDRDLDFLLSASPVLETLAVVGSLPPPLRARLASRSLQSAQFCLSAVEEVAAVDCPCLERLIIWMSGSLLGSAGTFGMRIKIGHAPRRSILGYLQPGAHVLEIGNTIIKPGTQPSPKTTVPSVHMLALRVHFRIRNEVKMLLSFLRCFPDVETLCVESDETHEPTGNVKHKFWQEAGHIECVQSHLKTLVFREFHGEPSELAFLKFIAENAQVLEKMVLVLKLGRHSAPEQVAEKLRALESARWASGSSKLRSLVSRLGEGVSAWSLRAGADSTCNDPFMCF
ncbi:hypothetical protein ACP4OV_009827 [Aristida adscensionis]